MGLNFENDIRNKLRETINEYDALYDSEQEWEEAKENLKNEFDDILKVIENDEYEDGVGKLEEFIFKLKDWHKELWRRTKD